MRAPDGTPYPDNFGEWEPWHQFEWLHTHGYRASWQRWLGGLAFIAAFLTVFGFLIFYDGS